MKRNLIISLISTILLLGTTYAYTDVPNGHWSANYIYEAQNYGLMGGMSESEFGFGANMKKSEFVTVLVKMFNWDIILPETPTFNDVSSNAWFYPYIETAFLHDVIDKTEEFMPNDYITREEMAVMFVRALGYDGIAEKFSNAKLNFTDVTTNKGYISVAYDISMTKGTSDSTFSPKNLAKREEVATMMVNVYKQYIKPLDWVHGFYALSSYNDREKTRDMDVVSVGWSRLSMNEDNQVYLNITSKNNNTWKVPDSYELITDYFDNNNTKVNLGVYMDMTEKITLDNGEQVSTLTQMLLDENLRKEAVDSIIDELNKEYTKIGKNPYNNGVTIDFEGLKGEKLKSSFNLFLQELKVELNKINKELFVTVQPVLNNGEYFDGFDYKIIGEIADKVILMAHDYNAVSLKGFEGSTYYKTTALTPISEVYYSLKAITDEETGVEDKNKIVLAISFSSIGFEIDENEKLKSGISVTPSTETIYKRLSNKDTIIGYSKTYQNPYIIYNTEDNRKIFLWYEDNRSILAKIKLAKMFGINGVSIWRLGNIPNYNLELNYNVFDTIIEECS